MAEAEARAAQEAGVVAVAACQKALLEETMAVVAMGPEEVLREVAAMALAIVAKAKVEEVMAMAVEEKAMEEEAMEQVAEAMGWVAEATAERGVVEGAVEVSFLARQVESSEEAAKVAGTGAMEEGARAAEVVAEAVTAAVEVGEERVARLEAESRV